MWLIGKKVKGIQCCLFINSTQPQSLECIYWDHEGNRKGDQSRSWGRLPNQTRESTSALSRRRACQGPGEGGECRFHASQNNEDHGRAKTTRALPRGAGKIDNRRSQDFWFWVYRRVKRDPAVTCITRICLSCEEDTLGVFRLGWVKSLETLGDGCSTKSLLSSWNVERVVELG